jgi:hypothetical protein
MAMSTMTLEARMENSTMGYDNGLYKEVLPNVEALDELKNSLHVWLPIIRFSVRNRKNNLGRNKPLGTLCIERRLLQVNWYCLTMPKLL